MNSVLKSPKRVWTPPTKEEKAFSKKTPGFGSLAKYVGTGAKPGSKKVDRIKPKTPPAESYAARHTRNPLFKWKGKDSEILVSEMDVDHLVGAIGYLYWGNKVHGWLVNKDPAFVITQHNFTYTVAWIKEAFDSLVTEAYSPRVVRHLTDIHKERINKIVKHIVVLRSKGKAKKGAKPKLEKTR